ncbi:glycosyltransferase family 4 protein [Desulfopila sp. IMCC35006]|uniref:glycosyltransferase n=1 Tax=Desulfopila sp. IMCC35006 TaxID=2569542 RepID=UPI0010AC5327|nr:glycosyltransferase [Desulfopila sp. IMCC35006]TKB23948.1 glycosyltransferase family 4 protein [Desulfopila sp. IMCC35006]
MNRAIWLTWENQVRNKSMASMLGVRLFTFAYGGNRIKRYLFCIVKSFLTLLRERPSIVFAQNPSIVLNYFLIFARPFFGYKFVSDAHYAGIIAFNENRFLQKALDISNRSADLVIVTNTEHARKIRDIGGRSAICEDPLPDIAKFYTEENKTDKTVFYICSYDIDEPFAVAFHAFKLLLKDDFKFLVTGNYKKAGIHADDYPHINFLGFLPEADFYGKLFESNVVLDLTENENCLLCGAYEAMMAEKPLVTSDTSCLRNYFHMGTVFTKHDERSIADAIRYAYQERISLNKDIRVWKDDIQDKQKDRLSNILKELNLA